MTIELKQGDMAPDFECKNQRGTTVKLTDFIGKKLVLFFYPNDLTPTCTKEVCNLRDNYSALIKDGYEILGVSQNDEKSHNKFIDKHELPFDLLADTEHKMLNDYGVWAEKQMYGRKYMGTLRTTFVIDEKGIISKIIDKVKSANHAEQILAG